MRRNMPALVAVAAAAAMLMLPGQAFAGRLVATGHDADSHCSGYDGAGQCHFVQVATGYVRGGAPVPARPLLVLDCSTGGNVSKALANAAVPGGPHQVVCPSANLAGFNGLRLTTATFSAMVVASSIDALSLTDTAAINGRKADIAAFFNQGGGILAFAGDSNGDDPADPYYQFAPIGIGGKAVTLSVPADDRGTGARLPRLGQRHRHERRHQLLPDAQLLPGAARRERAAGRGARLERSAGARDPVRGRDHQRRQDREEAGRRDRPALESKVRQPPQVPDPHPPARRHSDSDRARVPERQEDPRPYAQGVPEEPQGRERQPARPAAGQVQGAHRRADQRGQDAARHPHLPDLHQEAQVEAPAEA